MEFILIAQIPNLIYVSLRVYSYIQVFELNLTFNHNISVSPNNPRSFSAYNNELYVGTAQGLVLVIVNKIVTHTFTGCPAWISSLNSDNYGRIAIACYSNNLVNLYYYNGTSTGKSLTTSESPTYVGFDSKGRFVFLSKTEISIYF
jgi:hypothetical protein